MQAQALPLGGLMDLGRDGRGREPAKDVTDGGLARLVAEQPGHDPVLDDAAHPLGQGETVAEH